MSNETARLHAPRDLRIASESEPRAESGEELLRVDTVGICGSDLHWFTAGSIGDATLARPLVLGHEIGATIVSGPQAGQRVAVDPSVPCWHCPPCRDGHPNLCVNVLFAGHGDTDGGMRQLMSWPADRLHPVPDSISDAGVAMLEPLGVALHALDLARQRIGSSIGVVGCGPIGLLVVQLALLSAPAVAVAVEPLAHRRQRAADLGALALDPSEVPAAVGAVTQGVGLDAVIEIAGTDEAIQCAIDLVRPGGRVVLAGIPEPDRTTFVASTARRKGLTIAMSRRMKEAYPRAIALAAAGRVDLDGLVSEEFPLAQAADALSTAAQRRGFKILVRP